MFSGTIFTHRGKPAEALRLPRSCWTVYQRIDGETPIGKIASALGYSDAETFAAVRLLQAHDLIHEPIVTYADFRSGQDAPADDPSAASSTPSTGTAPTSRSAAGDGMVPSDPSPATEESDEAQEPDDGQDVDVQFSEPKTGSYATGSFDAADDRDATGAYDPYDSGEMDAADAPTQTHDAPVLHLPSLWTWMEGLSGNVKHYKNTQAFILMEASGALDDIGVESMDDLEALDVIRDPNVMRALENAVENNLNESIPESCYQ